MKSPVLSRRNLFGTATAALAAEAGTQLLTSPFLPKSAAMDQLKRAVLDGDGRALANDAFTPPSQPIFVIAVHAKCEAAGILNRPNPASVGIVGNALADLSTAFPMLGLTKQFGDPLKGVEPNIGMAMVPVTTTSGNHVYDGLRNTMEKTGCLPAFVNENANSMMTLHFASVGTADGATACFGKGGSQLITYSSIDAAVSSLLNALGPLKDLPPEAQKLLNGLNDRVTKDQKLRQGLESLANRLDAARTPLSAARSRANVRGTALTPATQLDDAMLAANNPLLPQFDTAAALMDLGLLHGATLSIANSDPNGGGDHAATGGNNVAYGAKSPNQVKSCIAQALAVIFQRYPDALVTFESDGGRTAIGGDSQNYVSALVGSAKRVKNILVNPDAVDDSAKFGSNPPVVTLSNGAKMVPNQSHMMSTLAKAAGLTLGDIPFIPALLVGA